MNIGKQQYKIDLIEIKFFLLKLKGGKGGGEGRVVKG